MLDLSHENKFKGIRKARNLGFRTVTLFAFFKNPINAKKYSFLVKIINGKLEFNKEKLNNLLNNEKQKNELIKEIKNFKLKKKKKNKQRKRN